MKRIVAVAAMSLMLISCSGGGSGGTPVAGQLTTASASLADGDIASAKATYTAIIGDGAAAQVTKATDSTNAEARFGRALCNIMLLIERSPFDAILAGFGQSPWKLATVFGDSGFFKLSLTDPSPILPSMPFYSSMKECQGGEGLPRKYLRCIPSHAASGYTSTAFTASYEELMPYVDSIIADLLVAIQTSTASYTIPKALYSGDADIPVNHADMVQILAGMYLMSASSDFANSWTFDMDLSQLTDATGKALLTPAQAIVILNQQFGLRADNRLVSARTNLQSWAEYSMQAAGEVLAGSTGGVLNLSSTNTELYQNFYDMVSSAVTSFSGNVVIADIQPEVTANLDTFFNSPPDGSDIGSDPFVLEGTKIRAVEAYWQQMITKACNFTIGTTTQVFTTAARAVQRPYYNLFTTIAGHFFGKYKAGRGA